MPVRYHIQLKSHRTTVSVDTILSELLAVNLGKKPGTPEAHRAVKLRLQEVTEQDKGRRGRYLSCLLTKNIILDLIDKKLSVKYGEYFDRWFKKWHKEKRRADFKDITRYHLTINYNKGSYRTTISMDTIISTLLAIQLGEEPETREAHRAIRQKLENLIKPYADRRTFKIKKLSQLATEEAILNLVDKKLSDQYWNYMTKK